MKHIAKVHDSMDIPIPKKIFLPFLTQKARLSAIKC